MDHAPMHGERLCQDGIGKIGQACLTERMDSALGEGKVDRL